MAFAKKILIVGCFLVLLIFSVEQVSSIGVTPSGAEINFIQGAGYAGNFVFNFLSEDSDKVLLVYPEGDLAEYARLSTEELVGGGEVRVSLNLPRRIEVPGPHRIFIVAKEAPPEEVTRNFFIGTATSVRAVLKVNVPYPGKYAESQFQADDANPGEPVNMRLKIFSRGDEEIVTASRIEIHEAGGFRDETTLSPIINFFKNPSLSALAVGGEGKLIETLDLGSDVILPGEFVEINARLDTTDYGSGNYRAIAIVQQGAQVVEKSDDFRLGELFVDIVDYSTELERNTVDSVLVDVESFWNDPIKNVFVTGEILGYDGVAFQTPSVDLEPWSRKRVKGHFDTSPIDVDSFQAKLTVHYAGKETEEIVNLHFVRRVDFVLIGLIAILVLAAGFFAWVVYDFLRARGKRGKKKKR